METYVIPFAGQYIIYRPLRRLALVANAALVACLREREAGGAPLTGKVADFLNAIDYWKSDPPALTAWLPRRDHRPTMAVLLMTSACNLRCTYCYARGGEDSHYQMPWPLAQTVIDAAHRNAKASGQQHFSLAFHGGGEPTLHWSMLQAAVDYARAKDLPCHISMASNGVWNEHQRRFILANFSALSVSFDGIQDVQDVQRPRANGKGSFMAVMRTLRALDEHNFNYGIRLTATLDSFAHLPESIAMLCAETQCKTMQVEPCYTSERGTYADPTVEQGEAFVRAFMAAFRVAAENGRTLFYSGARPWLISSTFCTAPENALVATPEGDLVACFETHDRRHPLTSRFTVGRVSGSEVSVDTQTIHRFAEQQQQNRSACEGCFCYWHCGGDCASRCSSSPVDQRGRCHVNRAITRELLGCFIAAGNGIWRG